MLLSDTPSSEAKHVVGMGDGTAVSGLPGFPPLVQNHYLSHQRKGKSSQDPGMLSGTCPKQSLHPVRAGRKKKAPHAWPAKGSWRQHKKCCGPAVPWKAGSPLTRGWEGRNPVSCHPIWKGATNLLSWDKGGGETGPGSNTQILYQILVISLNKCFLICCISLRDLKLLFSK